MIIVKLYIDVPLDVERVPPIRTLSLSDSALTNEEDVVKLFKGADDHDFFENFYPVNLACNHDIDLETSEDDLNDQLSENRTMTIPERDIIRLYHKIIGKEDSFLIDFLFELTDNYYMEVSLTT